MKPRIPWWLQLGLALISSMALVGCARPTPTSIDIVITQPPVEHPTAMAKPPVEPTQEATLAATSGPKIITMTFIGAELESLNPIYAYSWSEECILDLILLSLWNIDSQGNHVMDLATELPTQENGGVSEDGLALTIRLHPEAAWSDGTPVTAQDAVFTYQMIMSEANSTISRYPWDSYVESVSAPDDHTLQIKLNMPYPDWSITLFTGLHRILPKHILEPVFQANGTLDNAEWNSLPNVSNGPFLVSEFEPASHVSLLANPDYWRGRPRIDKINIRLVKDRAAQLAALASGESDIGTYIIGSEVPEIQQMGDMEIISENNGYQVVIYENTDPKTAHPAMTDGNVRRALALAIDRPSIIDGLYPGLYEIPVTYWHGTIYNHPSLKPYPYDPAQARKLLEEAGWVDQNVDGIREKDARDLALRYAYIEGDENTDTLVANIQQMLAEVGIKLNLSPTTADILWGYYDEGGLLAKGQYDLAHWSDGLWYYPSPETSYFTCDQIASAENPWGYNWFGICIPEMDELFAQQAVELDQQKRIEELHQIGQIMYDQTLIIPLRTDPDVWAVNNRLANIRFSGVDPLMYAWEWDVK